MLDGAEGLVGCMGKLGALHLSEATLDLRERRANSVVSLPACYNKIQ